MESGYQLVQDGTVLLNVYKNEEYAEMRGKSKFAKMVSGTAYDTMAMKNTFEDVTEDFLKPKPKKGIFTSAFA